MEQSRGKWRYTLTDNGKSGILRIDNEQFILCPICGKRWFRFRPAASCSNLGQIEVKCKRCGGLIGLNIWREP